jgi:AraC-like DNA-binding protein
VSLCALDYQLSSKALLHLLPFLIMVCLGLFINVFRNKLETIFQNMDYLFYLIYRPVLYVQMAFYIISSFSELRKYRFQLKEFYSNIVKIDLQWVNLILYFLILMWSTDMAIYTAIVLDIQGNMLLSYLSYQTISINLILCICLIYKGMGQASSPAGKISLPKYVQNNIELSNYEEYKNQLTQLMRVEKPYLMPELSLEELAKKMNITPRLLSQVIHVCFNQNFNNYINQYRVEEAKLLFANDEKNKKSIFEILLDSGFNSKSAFNYSFKKITGITPKEFRIKIKI